METELEPVYIGALCIGYCVVFPVTTEIHYFEYVISFRPKQVL